MNKKTEVIICLGSSCFARGNKTTLGLIDKYIRDNQLQDKVFFHGGHCFNKCSEGPVIKIDNETYTGVNELNIIDILNKSFNKILSP